MNECNIVIVLEALLLYIRRERVEAKVGINVWNACVTLLALCYIGMPRKAVITLLTS